MTTLIERLRAASGPDRDMPTLLHYSKEPLVAVRDTLQPSTPQMKPRGLWVSVEGEDDWKSWCESEQFAVETFASPPVEIVLAPNSNILWLATDHDIIQFGREFQEPSTPHWRLPLNWSKVADQYQGIIIAPYSWECRYLDETSWYYGWDCASGCIWDSKAIACLLARGIGGKG